MGNMKDGDVYFWRWKDDERHKDCAPFRSYHCKSQKSIVVNGVPCDTYWGDYDRRPLDLDAVILTYQGNINEMTEIREGETNYYRHEDIVDMRHPNSSRAKIYIKPGARRDPSTMLEYLRYQLDKARNDERWAKRRQEDLMQSIADVNAGKLDKIYL